STVATPTAGSTPGLVPEPVQYFLTIDGVNGGSLSSKHPGAFEISDYGFHIDYPVAFGGSGAGKAEFSPLTVALDLGAGFSALLTDIASGRHLEAVRLEGVNAAGQTVYDLRLTNVVLDSYEETNQGKDQLSFAYNTIEVKVQSQNPDGTLNPVQGFGWDATPLITGGAGDDWLYGSSVDNTLIGGPGDDTLSGGAGADSFVYRTGDGTDTVVDFSIAEGDTLDFRGVVGVHALSDLNIRQVGADTVITLGSGVILENVLVETLTPAQFLFSQAPSDIALSNAMVPENSAAGTVVGMLTATDADAGEIFTFSLLADADGRFALDGTNLVVAGALDHEAAASHAVTVRVADSIGNTFDKSILIEVGDVNEAPTGIALSGSTIAENSAAGTVVGALAGSDPDAGDVFGFSLLDDAGGLFAIDGTDLVVAGALDYEQAQGHVVLVRVTDSGGLTYDEAFALEVLNVPGVTITGSQKADRIDAAQTVAGQPLPTGEEDAISGGGASDRIDALGGNDIVSGGDAADWLNGGAGDDVLTGGAAADRFVFEPGFGHDRITDFSAPGQGQDFVEFDREIFADFAALLAATRQEGADVVITADADNSVTLEGVSLSELSAGSFDFVL
ncbi:MAG TPA: type VI secretion system tube protein Hcp, partial [Burkholderiales bacterium]